jgi:hypothetical protein
MGTTDNATQETLGGEACQQVESAVGEVTDEHTPEQRTRRQGDNLKPYHFPKGVSGNPNGRPKGSKSLRERLWARLEAPQALDGEPMPEGKVLADQFIDAVIGAALDGSVPAMQLIWERLHGKLANTVDVNIQTMSDRELVAKAVELLGGEQMALECNATVDNGREKAG